MADLRDNLRDDELIQKLGRHSPSFKLPAGSSSTPTPKPSAPQSDHATAPDQPRYVRPAAALPEQGDREDSSQAPADRDNGQGRAIDTSPGDNSGRLSRGGSTQTHPGEMRHLPSAPTKLNTTKGINTKSFFIRAVPGIIAGFGVWIVGGILIFALFAAALSFTGPGGDASAGNTTIVPGECPVSRVEYTDQYSEEQLRRIFGAPGENLTTVEFLGLSMQVNKKVAPCLVAVSDSIKASGLSYRPSPDKGGMHCYREDVPKFLHVYGAACDINPYTNPNMQIKHQLPHNPNCPLGEILHNVCYDMPDQYRQIFAAHGFTWGGNWRNEKDYMHFEWHGEKP
jgi:hypothetical protein